MASDAKWWTDPRMIAAAIWIFGCASYFYVRFTFTILDDHGDALRALISRFAEWFAPPRPAA